MARKFDITGERFGMLTVVGPAGRILYGGRNCTAWLCRCDCGNEITLPVEKLPTSARNRETMMRGGRKLYDRCEECRQKICPVCGKKFSHSHPSHVCPDPECQEILRQERDAYWHAVHKYMRQTDSSYREACNAYQRARHQRLRDVIGTQRSEKYAKMNDADRAHVLERGRRYYREMRADPERYANWLDWHRKYRAKRHLESLAADAARLQTLIEESAKNE